MGHHSLGCAVEHLPMTMRCQSRERVLAWYAAHETVCLEGRAEHDNFQFGVPSEMGSIAASKDVPPHRVYWGFDSFRGLPDVSAEPGYRNPLWKTGARDRRGPPAALRRARGALAGVFSDVHEMSSDFRLNARPREARWEYVPRRRDGGPPRPLTVEAAVARREKQLGASANRITLVAGYYNESLTPQLGRSARPALFADFNCDLYSSTVTAQRWLFAHRLLRPGAIVSYDDWFNTPFGSGESGAHVDIAREHRVHYTHLGAKFAQGPGVACKLVFFRIESVGVRAHPGITRYINHTRYWNRRQ